jgi:excisionase family DNA binding protein
MSLADRIRALVGALPPDAMVPVRWLGDLLEAEGSTVQTDAERLSDLTVEEVAADFGRSVDTVRRWIRRGELRAYQLGQEYRIPRAAVRAFVEAQRDKTKVAPAAAAEVDVGRWRKIREAR